MRPEEIQNRDFLVGLRGYDKDEVRSFLAEVAAEHAALLAEVDQASVVREVVAPVEVVAPMDDDFESLGASVAAVLRAAKESAAGMTAEASDLQMRAIEEAGDLRRQAEADAEKLRADARAALDEARAEAERVVGEASARVRSMEIEIEARVSNREAEAARRESAARTRILEASEELQLALVALDGDEADVDRAGLGSTEAHSVDSTH